MNPSTSAALIPASSRQALMHSKWSECVLASGRLPTLVSATPTMAYLPLMFDIKASTQNSRSNGVKIRNAVLDYAMTSPCLCFPIAICEITPQHSGSNPVVRDLHENESG